MTTAIIGTGGIGSAIARQVFVAVAPASSRWS